MEENQIETTTEDVAIAVEKFFEIARDSEDFLVFFKEWFTNAISQFKKSKNREEAFVSLITLETTSIKILEKIIEIRRNEIDNELDEEDVESEKEDAIDETEEGTRKTIALAISFIAAKSSDGNLKENLVKKLLYELDFKTPREYLILVHKVMS